MTSQLNEMQSLTFSKFQDAFSFNVQYEPLSFLTQSQIEHIAEQELATVKVGGVAEAYAKHGQAETKGVKVHFGLDKSGIFNIEKSNIEFQLQPEEVCDF